MWFVRGMDEGCGFFRMMVKLVMMEAKGFEGKQ